MYGYAVVGRDIHDGNLAAKTNTKTIGDLGRSRKGLNVEITTFSARDIKNLGQWRNISDRIILNITRILLFLEK